MRGGNNKPSFQESVTYSFEYQKEYFWQCRYISSEVTRGCYQSIS